MGDFVRRFVPMWQRRLVDPFVWTPAIIPGCILYGGAYQEARATRAAQPTLLNGSFESGTANWIGYNSPTFTVESSGAADGSKWGKVAYNGTASPQVAQSILIAGNRYAIGGWARGDGTYLARVMPGGVACFNSTTSTDWQAVTGDATATNALLYCICNAGAAGFAGFDGLTCTNRSLQSYTPQYTTIPGSVLAQATATAQPWVSSDGLGIRYQGGDLLQWSAEASAVKCLHDGTGGTLIVAVRPSVLSTIHRILGTAVTGAATIGMSFGVSNTNAAYLQIANGSGALDVDTSVATPIAINTTYILTIRIAAGANGVTVRKNGSNIITATLTAPSSANPTTGLMLGAWAAGSGAGFDGIVGHPFVANRVLSDAECTQIENYILAQATL